jgi:hypothetical protein
VQRAAAQGLRLHRGHLQGVGVLPHRLSSLREGLDHRAQRHRNLGYVVLDLVPVVAVFGVLDLVVPVVSVVVARCGDLVVLEAEGAIDRLVALVVLAPRRERTGILDGEAGSASCPHAPRLMSHCPPVDGSGLV